jgi:hypothetical protein
MSKVLEKLASAGYLDADAKARVESTVAEFLKLAEEDPEFHEEAMQKVAFLGKLLPSGAQMGEAAKALGAVALVSGGAALGAEAIGAARDAIRTSQSYKKMLDENPDLSKLDAKLVQKNFKTLSNFNPEYARDPQVAGAYVRQQSTAEGMNWPLLQNVMQAGQKSRPPQHATGFSAISQQPDLVAKALMGQGPFAPKSSGGE